MRKFLFMVIVSVAPVCVFAQTLPKYTIKDLGSLPGKPNCSALAVSQSGLVAGWCGASAGAFTGFLYSNGVMKDLGAPAMPDAVVPLAVNDAGVVVGDYLQGNSIENVVFAGPFLYQNGSVQPMPNIFTSFVPFGLNNSGQIAGTEFNSLAERFVNYFYGQAILIPTLGGQPTTLLPIGVQQGVALAISPNGAWVAGASASRDGATVTPTLWRAGIQQALPLLAGFQYAEAASVNDSGTAAGAVFSINYLVDEDPAAVAHAALFNNNAVTDLGLLAGDRSSFAIGINNSGLIVGYSTALVPGSELQLRAYISPADPQSHAFLYANGAIRDLTKLLVNGTGWQLSFAMAINNAGQIVGTGTYQGQQRAFLLTPVAAPQINSVASAGLSVPGITNLSPNGLFTIFGTGFAPASMHRTVVQADLVNDALPTNLANTCVQAGAARWPVTYVSATQVNALAGSMPPSGKMPLSVITNCGMANELATDSFNATMAGEAPEFLYFVQNANGYNPVVAIQAQSGAYVGPANLIPGAVFTPAQPNDVLTVFGVGWGSTDPHYRIDPVCCSVQQSAATRPIQVRTGQ